MPGKVGVHSDKKTDTGGKKKKLQWKFLAHTKKKARILETMKKYMPLNSGARNVD